MYLLSGNHDPSPTSIFYSISNFAILPCDTSNRSTKVFSVQRGLDIFDLES